MLLPPPSTSLGVILALCSAAAFRVLTSLGVILALQCSGFPRTSLGVILALQCSCFPSTSLGVILALCSATAFRALV